MSKILLVEDDPMIAEIYMKKFEMANLEVFNATNGKEALKEAISGKYDLMLLDMVIPEMSGMDVLKELKRSGKYELDTKVIVFSNLNETDTQKEAMDNGADGFIGKTQYTPSEMVVQVQRLLNEFSEQRKNRSKNGDGEKKERNGGGKKILFIEDEEIFLDLFGSRLKEDGFEVTFAKNGAWGVKEAMENDYDLIITDMVMPAMGGLEIVGKLKQEEKTKDIPIIVLSASVDEDGANEVRSLGIEEFFLKTRIVPSDLARKVGEVLE
jgi:DNA-binding response OmpR family regulator